MNNAILLLDVATAALNVSLKVQELLQKAATEGRDVTDEELAALKVQNDVLANKIINS
jgi:hypothetical protein